MSAGDSQLSNFSVHSLFFAQQRHLLLLDRRANLLFSWIMTEFLDLPFFPCTYKSLCLVMCCCSNKGQYPFVCGQSYNLETTCPQIKLFLPGYCLYSLPFVIKVNSVVMTVEIFRRSCVISRKLLDPILCRTVVANYAEKCCF